MNRGWQRMPGVLLAIAMLAYAYGWGTGNAWVCRVVALFGLALPAYAGLYVLTGMTGIVSLFTSASVGVGAYVAAIAMTRAGVPIGLALALSCLTGALASWAVAALTTRLADHYLTLATLAGSEVLGNVFRGWTTATGGANGFPGIPKPTLLGHALGTPIDYAPFCLLGGVVAVFAAARIQRSSLGAALMAYREDGQRVEAIGLDSAHLRRAAFLLAGGGAGLSGGLSASVDGFVGPESFGVAQAIMMLCFFYVAADRGIAGILLSAALATAVAEVFRSAGAWQSVILGMVSLAILARRARTDADSTRRRH